MTRFLRLSEAIEELRGRAYGNFAQPANLKKAKRANPNPTELTKLHLRFRDGSRFRDAARRVVAVLSRFTPFPQLSTGN